MIIAIASGKGGTGKTTVATNLAVTLAQNGRRVQLLDCDVEEPNCHIFMKPNFERSEVVGCPVPEVDADRCTECGKCGEVCQYSAIVCIKSRSDGKMKVLTFPELCHGCGGCSLVCPADAITEKSRELGVVETGIGEGVPFAHGRMRVQEAMSPPLIREVKRRVDSTADVVIFDAPPGTSCPVVAVVKDADFVLLVTEPTPFGLNDLKLAVETVREVGRPFGVVVNRADVGDDCVTRYCADEQIDILAEIPDDRRVAESYSRGELMVSALPEYESAFAHIFEKIEDEVGT